MSRLHLGADELMQKQRLPDEINIYIRLDVPKDLHEDEQYLPWEHVRKRCGHGPSGWGGSDWDSGR